MHRKRRILMVRQIIMLKVISRLAHATAWCRHVLSRVVTCRGSHEPVRTVRPSGHCVTVTVERVWYCVRMPASLIWYDSPASSLAPSVNEPSQYSASLLKSGLKHGMVVSHDQRHG